MDPRIFITQNYEIKKLSKACNFKGCDRTPVKELLIWELDLRTLKKRELVSLYFCTKHYKNEAKALVKKLNELCEKGKIIDKKVFDVGYVTH